MSVERSARKPKYVSDIAGGNVLLDLFVIDQHVGDLLSRTFDGVEITPTQYAVYSTLGRKSLTPTMLGETLGIHLPTLSGLLSTMESRGDLHRVRSTTDRRSYSVSLTEAGLARLDKARSRFRKALRAMNLNLGDADNVEQVRAMLLRIDTAITRATDSL